MDPARAAAMSDPERNRWFRRRWVEPVAVKPPPAVDAIPRDHDALGRGDLEAIKLGTRTLIDVEAGLAWLATMPRAQVGVAKSQSEKRLAP